MVLAYQNNVGCSVLTIFSIVLQVYNYQRLGVFDVQPIRKVAKWYVIRLSYLCIYFEEIFYGKSLQCTF
jgi:hypothetical protein